MPDDEYRSPFLNPSQSAQYDQNLASTPALAKLWATCYFAFINEGVPPEHAVRLTTALICLQSSS